LLIQDLNRHDSNACILLFDLDKFKRINDNYGHAVGDKALIAFAKVLTNQCRTNDVIARYGGEEFVMLLRHTSVSGALELANRIRENTHDIKLSHNGEPIKLTTSVGVSNIEKNNDIEISIKSADIALYKAKKSGRNRVVLNTINRSVQVASQLSSPA